MLGKTHFFIGISTALAVLQPQSVPVLVTGISAAAVGSVISDIDSGTSQAHQEADKVMAVTVSVIGLMLFLEYKFHLGIYERLMKNSSIMRVLTGGILFLIICTYGKDQPHRSFMHSLVAGFMLTCCVNIIYPDAGPYFAVAFLSHLALDLLNYKRVKIFWPLKKGYSLRFCSADGWVNRLLLWLGPIALAAELIFSAPAVRLVDRILSIFAAWNDILEFRNVELLCISPKHLLPPLNADNCDCINFRMILKRLKGVHNNRSLMYCNELFRNVLMHSVAGTAGD